ncbi:MAG: M23 family metallopeptidase [Chitinophagaceae bacterium]
MAKTRKFSGKCGIILFLGIFYLLPVKAQLFPATAYPQNFFRNPLNIPISLSGNFGELRSNHYHMGLDLKTQARENLPVHAAADGYVARIKVEPGGFGRAIYLNHPNGLTTLYAHLNDFYPELERYVREQQYKQESWPVYLDIPPTLFPVKKGQFIAYSGNTGGSGGPHVHFEIRETSTDKCINPMLFGLPITDNVAPSILRLSLYDRNRSVYEQSPTLYPVKKLGGKYVTTPTVISTSLEKVSFAITSFDTHTGSSNLNGVYSMVLYDNDKAVNGFRMEKIGYEDTRYLNAHIDYRTKANGGPWLQHLAELPGYINSVYRTFSGNGVIDLSDGAIHDIRIEVRDADGNLSTLSFKIRQTAPYKPVAPAAGKRFYPLMLDVYESEDLEFFLGEQSLYDSVSINHTRSVTAAPDIVSAVHTIGAAYIPLQDYFAVRILPNKQITAEQKQRTLMQRITGAKKQVVKVEWQQDWAFAKFRDFGVFRLVVDEQPPVIVPVGFTDATAATYLKTAKRFVFTVKDNYEQWQNFSAELDGKWLRFTNDKGRNYIYPVDERCGPGAHELKITVEDIAGNKTEKVYRFTR